MKLNFAALAAIALVSTPLLADQPATDQAAPAADKAKKICRMVPVTGSNFPKRVCMTAELWKQIQDKRNADSESALERKGSMGAGADRN